MANNRIYKYKMRGIQVGAVAWALYEWMKSKEKIARKNRIIRFNYRIVSKFLDQLYDRENH